MPVQLLVALFKSLWTDVVVGMKEVRSCQPGGAGGGLGCGPAHRQSLAAARAINVDSQDAGRRALVGRCGCSHEFHRQELQRTGRRPNGGSRHAGHGPWCNQPCALDAAAHQPLAYQATLNCTRGLDAAPPRAHRGTSRHCQQVLARSRTRPRSDWSTVRFPIALTGQRPGRRRQRRLDRRPAVIVRGYRRTGSGYGDAADLRRCAGRLCPRGMAVDAVAAPK